MVGDRDAELEKLITRHDVMEPFASRIVGIRRPPFCSSQGLAMPRNI
jgi:hypothetical protein